MNRKRRFFRRRNDLSLSVNGAGGGKGNRLNIVRLHRLQDIECGRSVLLEVSCWILQSKTNVSVGRKVKHPLAAAHCCRQSGKIQNISAHQLEIKILLRLRQKGVLYGGKIVPPDHLITRAKQAISQMAADEACGPGDKALHCEATSRGAAARSRSISCKGSNLLKRSLSKTRSQVNGSRTIDTFFPSVKDRDR